MSNRLIVLIEGWRFISHSYALINQWQCLELLKSPDIDLFHRDTPFFHPEWRSMRGLFSPEEETALQGLRPLEQGQAADVVFRFDIPHRLDPSGSKKTFVFVTAEHSYVPDEHVAGNIPLNRASAGTDVRIITPSRWSEKGIVRSGVEADRVRIVPHGVNPGIFHPVGAAEKEALKKLFHLTGRYCFLHIGAMSLNKGVDVLFKAFLNIIEKYPQAHLILKGNDSLFPSKLLMNSHVDDLHAQDPVRYSEQRIKRLANHVTYIGESLDIRSMARLYQLADAYVAPYRSEAFNLPVLEAAACGLPVICTAGGPTDDFTTSEFALRINSAIRRFSSQDDTRFCLEPDPVHLEELMERGIRDDAFCSQAREAGRKHVAGRYTWRHCTEKLVQLFAGS